MSSLLAWGQGPSGSPSCVRFQRPPRKSVHPPPTWRDALTSTEPEERVERLADLLRQVRRRLERHHLIAAPTADDLATFDTDLYIYDDALVAVADLLDVEVPPAARDELTPGHRDELEAALAAAGLDLGGGEAALPR